MKRRNGIELLPLYKKKLASSCRHGRNPFKRRKKKRRETKRKEALPDRPTQPASA
jgi:hypothetical protein